MTTVVGVLGRGLVDPSGPLIWVDDLGLTRGDGCFEATRVVTTAAGDSRIDHLPAHLRRLAHSAATLELPEPDPVAWTELIHEAVAQWSPQRPTPDEAQLRLLYTYGRESQPALADSPDDRGTGIVQLTPLDANIIAARAGIDVATLIRPGPAMGYQAVPWMLGGVKTISYAVNRAAQRHAQNLGCQDALFVSADGYALEGPTSALVWHIDGLLCSTLTEGTGVLASVTQQHLFAQWQGEGLPTGYGLATIPELLHADGVWLVSSVRGIAPVLSLDTTRLTHHVELTRGLVALAGFEPVDSSTTRRVTG